MRKQLFVFLTIVTTALISHGSESPEIPLSPLELVPLTIDSSRPVETNVTLDEYSNYQLDIKLYVEVADCSVQTLRRDATFLPMSEKGQIKLYLTTRRDVMSACTSEADSSRPVHLKFMLTQSQTMTIADDLEVLVKMRPDPNDFLHKHSFESVQTKFKKEKLK